MSRAVRVLLCGYYGYGNAGDEIVLAGILNSIRQHVSSGRIDVRVMSGFPEHTRELHGVSSVPRFSPVSVVSSLLWADWLVLGGGSLIQDSTSKRSARYYLTLLRTANMLRVKTFLWAQGFGPLEDDGLRNASVKTLNRAAGITLRDNDSRDDLLNAGVNPDKLSLSADPAFLVTPADDYPFSEFFESANRAGGLIGISLRKWDATPWDPAAVAKGVKRFCEASEIQPMFVPFQQPHDVEISNHAADCAGLPSAVLSARPAPAQMAAIIGNFRIILGMRLHSLILSAAAGRPFIGINYDPKVGSFCRAAGMPLIELSGLSEGRVYQELSDLNANYIQQRSKIEQFREEQLKMASVSSDLFASLTI